MNAYAIKNADQRVVWYCMPIIPVLVRLRQENGCVFQTSLGHTSEFKTGLYYIANLVSKNKIHEIKKKPTKTKQTKIAKQQ